MKGLLFALALVAAPVLADSNQPPAPLANTQLSDARQEAEAKALMETIRCLVCQGQSIADSNAELAGDMRAMIRARIAAGERPAAIRDWLVQRYGSWVSYDPPVDRTTGALWTAPIVFVAVGFMVARSSFRKRRA